MFEPTQTVPRTLTAVCALIGALLTVGLTVLALLNTEDTDVLAGIGTHEPRHSGLLFLTAVFASVATFRPLLGGVALVLFGGFVVPTLPVIGVIGIAFGLLSLVRAHLARRHVARLAAAAEAEGEPDMEMEEDAEPGARTATRDVAEGS
ncbi:hypothetical protein GF314_06110 [bacterium]|nr:hypothetical protein [bacterium]